MGLADLDASEFETMIGLVNDALGLNKPHQFVTADPVHAGILRCSSNQGDSSCDGKALLRKLLDEAYGRGLLERPACFQTTNKG